jgi:REP element-mobilizing transposase RayT
VARPLRIEFEGALYHITARGNVRQKLFLDDKDCAKFVELLRASLTRYDVILHAYVLMGNHYHLIAETRRANLGRWMHWLSTSYTVYFNWRHRRVGHLFQGRYKSIVVEAEGYLLTLSRYVHLNPVRGQMIGKGSPVERRKRLREWKWSSYRGYSGLVEPEGWMQDERILGEMGGIRLKGERLRYRRYVEEGLLREIENPLEAVQWQTVLGQESFLQRLKDRMEKPARVDKEVPARRLLQERSRVGRILGAVATAYGCGKADLLRAGGKGNEARAVAMVLVWDCCGMRLQELTELFEAPGYTAAAQMIKRTRDKDSKGELQFNLTRLMTKCVK